MDYVANISNTYSIDLEVNAGDYGLYLLGSHGSANFLTLEELGMTQDTSYDYVVSSATNYYNRQVANGSYSPNSFLKGLLYKAHDSNFNRDVLYSINSQKVDYVYFVNTGGSYILRGNELVHNDYQESILDMQQLTYYSQVNATASSFVNSTNYSSYTINVGVVDSKYQRAVFDYSNIGEHVINNYNYPAGLQNQYVVRGENISFNQYVLEIDVVQGGSFDISFGNPYTNLGDTEYQRGFNNGRTTGYTNGLEQGIQIGRTQAGTGTPQTPATAFSYITNAFGVVGNVMSLEVLPSITLGTCFSIPLVLILIMTIFKLVRK